MITIKIRLIYTEKCIKDTGEYFSHNPLFCGRKFQLTSAERWTMEEEKGPESPFVGPPSDEQAERDVSRGHAEPRNDAEDEAAKDYVDEALTTGKDPLSSDEESSSKEK
jgi:hypothetical protein